MKPANSRRPECPTSGTTDSIVPRIAIYGGAFDPPHIAHVFAVSYLLGRDDVDSVWVLPTARHAFGKSMAPFEARVRMLARTLRPLDADRVVISTFEQTAALSGYTYDTLAVLAARHPEHDFAIVLGADNLDASDRWYRFDDLVGQWPVIALGRPGHEAAMHRWAEAPWMRCGPTLPDVSSTAIREAIRAGTGEASVWIPAAIRDDARLLYGGSQTPLASPVTVFGAGRAGRALAAALRAACVEVNGVWNRVPCPGATHSGDALGALAARPGTWWIAISDDAIAPFARRLADLDAVARSLVGRVALHCAGRHGAEVLAPLADAGASTGSLHPLQALNDPARAAADLDCAWFAVEGIESARAEARRLATALGGTSVEIPAGGKATYHAAAVLAGNFVVTLMTGGVELLGSLGIAADEARAMLAPLQRGALGHAAAAPIARALTGPLARGDIDAVRAHMQAIRSRAPELAALYATLARTTASALDWNATQLAALDAALSGRIEGRRLQP